MNFESFVTERLADLTSKYNALVVNAKRIFELPVQNNLDPTSLIHVSRNGISESLEIQKIIDGVSARDYDHLISIGEITISGTNVTFPASAEWVISNTYYQNIADITRSIPLAASGLTRIDIAVANTSNDIVIMSGDETDGIAVRPNIPVGTVLVTQINITDSSIVVIPPVLGTEYVKKLESQDVIVNYGATTVIEQINLTDDRNSISLIGAATDVKSIQVSGLYIRMGKPHFFKNRTGHPVKLWHLAGTGNIKYFFPNGLDLIVKPNEVIEFNTNANDSAYVRFERVGNDVSDHFKGVFATFSALNSALPTANIGDYAQVNAVGATDVVNYNWDAEENIWVQGGSSMIGNTDSLPEGTTNLYWTTARGLATLLTGISFVTGTAITATDSFLSAFGKIQKQINDILVSIGLKGDTKTYNHYQSTALATWTINHNLNNKFPNITIFDFNGYVMIPTNIQAIDNNQLKVFFPTAISGFATLCANENTFTITYDADAQLFFTSVPTLTDVNKLAVNQLVLDLKYHGLWGKILMLNIKAGSTATEHKWNLKDPRDLDAAYRQTYSGTWVHSSLGSKSNGTNAFANMYLNPSVLGLNGNFSMGMYVTETPINFGDNYLMGGHSGANNFLAIQRGTATTLTYTAYASGATPRTTPLGMKGFVAISVIGSVKKGYYETSILESVATNGTGVPNVNIYEGALNLGGFYGGTGFTAGTSFVGTGLTDAEILNLRSSILTYETSLGRN